MIDESLFSIFKKMIESYQQTLIHWQQKSRTTNKSLMNLNDWLFKTRKIRILCTFFRLITFFQTNSLNLIDEQNRKFDWVKMTFNILYEFEQMSSFYENHIKNICVFENFFKIKIIVRFINRKWISNEKIMFCIMKFINVFILYWIWLIQRHKHIRFVNNNNFCDSWLKRRSRLFITIWKNRKFKKLFDYFKRIQTS